MSTTRGWVTALVSPGPDPKRNDVRSSGVSPKWLTIDGSVRGFCPWSVVMMIVHVSKG